MASVTDVENVENEHNRICWQCSEFCNMFPFFMCTIRDIRNLKLQDDNENDNVERWDFPCIPYLLRYWLNCVYHDCLGDPVWNVSLKLSTFLNVIKTNIYIEMRLKLTHKRHIINTL